MEKKKVKLKVQKGKVHIRFQNQETSRGTQNSSLRKSPMKVSGGGKEKIGKEPTARSQKKLCAIFRKRQVTSFFHGKRVKHPKPTSLISFGGLSAKTNSA